MVSFKCDYNNGVHPDLLRRLADTNDEILTPYGFDRYSLSAAEKIRKTIGRDDAEIMFLGGGTQTNQVVISSILAPWQGVVSPVSGHINAHEAGAVEYSSHKVLPLRAEYGKISADDLDRYVSGFYSDESHTHMVFPGMVYISFPTEYGTIYSKKELSDIKKVCEKYSLPLFIDGARLGYGLASPECDLTIKEFASLCDIFYIGGTKVGAICGEAVVFTHHNMPENFFTMVKQHGAVFAKGRINGVQFDALFDKELYFEIGKRGIETAMKLKAVFEEKGYRFFIPSPTNQQFVILDNEKMNSLRDKLEFEVWEKYDENHTVVRFVTSWSTKDSDIEYLKSCL